MQPEHAVSHRQRAPGAELAAALKIVAQLICGGLRTRIYWVSLGGFDTHAQQVDGQRP